MNATTPNVDTIIQGDCLEEMKKLPDGCIDLTVTSPPYDNLRTKRLFSMAAITYGMKRTTLGQFAKGVRNSPKTEFKKGEHWRPHKQHWDKDYLLQEYVTNEKSCSTIAEENGISIPAVYHWLRKHGIPRRNMSEARSIKYWGSAGENNPMYGKHGADHPMWKGGLTPERQALYASLEWAKVVKSVWKRDNGTCRRCNTKNTNGKSDYHIHHVVSFSDDIEKRTDISNLVLLCPNCHYWVHSKKNISREFIKC